MFCKEIYDENVFDLLDLTRFMHVIYRSEIKNKVLIIKTLLDSVLSIRSKVRKEKKT